MERRHLKAMAYIIIVFAIGLVGFYAFSAMYGDGLERTMGDGGVEEGDPVYSAPLDYGSDYGSSLIMGLVGFLIVLGAVLAYLVVVKRRAPKGSN